MQAPRIRQQKVWLSTSSARDRTGLGRSLFVEVPKRYSQRNKEMVEACDILHAFISVEDGPTGGTRFEVEYAVSIGIPVQVHWENGNSEWIFQYSFPFPGQKQAFLLSWEGFFDKIRFALGGTS
jgi:hypothetical protein